MFRFFAGLVMAALLACGMNVGSPSPLSGAGGSAVGDGSSARTGDSSKGDGDGANSADNSGSDNQPQASFIEPMGAGSADPIKSTVDKVYFILKKFSVLCVYNAEKRIRFKAEGHLKTKDGEDRIVRIVNPQSKNYLDLLADQQNKNGYVSFIATSKLKLNYKLYVMPKGFVPGPLNTLLPCEEGSCAPGGKKPMTFAPPDFCCDGDLCMGTEPGQIDEAPECPSVDQGSGLDLHPVDSGIDSIHPVTIDFGTGSPLCQ